MFIKTTKEAAPGSKQTVLERFLGKLRDLGIDPEFTLSDKDWSEINAMGLTWPDAKHQLCFWHAVRAIKQHLCKNKETPAVYDAFAARREFSFIDLDFIPAGQHIDAGTEPVRHPCYCSANNGTHCTAQISPPPERPVPRIRPTFLGRPSVITPALPTIKLTPDVIARALRPALDTVGGPGTHSCAFEETDLTRLSDLPALEDEEDSDGETSWAKRADAGEELEDEDLEGFSDASEVNDSDDYRHELGLINRDEGNVRGRPSSSLPSESGPNSQLPGYQFCPPAHRLPLLRLFSKHACQHPLLPERHDESRSSEDIYRDAVREMYRHCKLNRLPEVWAYLWNSWYTRPRWKLWARSAYAASIPRKRTTMIVESLWRNLKRLVLHMYNRPPIDLALYAIVTKAIPPYRVTLSEIITNSRSGRAAACSNAQRALKRAWERLRKVPVHGNYTTNVARWTCDCGSQKYHANLLCKHLVHKAGALPAEWWPNAVRYHIQPFYTVPINGKIAPAPETMRNHSWTQRMRSKPSAIIRRPLRYCTPEDNTGDSDVDIPTSEGRASSPVCPDPSLCIAANCCLI